MFKSLKAWINIPFTVKPYIERNATGLKIFKEPVEALCYPEGKVQVVTGYDGKEVVSNKVLYVPGTMQVSELDNIIFEGKEQEIKSIGYFYRNKVVDVKMIYL